MVYFDRKTLRILRHINSCGDKGITWEKLREKFGEDDANIFLLEDLSKEHYTVTKDQNGKWVDFSYSSGVFYSTFRSYCSPKGKQLLETRSFDFWKWIIPTIISVIALALSLISVLLSVFGSDVIKVVLLK